MSAIDISQKAMANEKHPWLVENCIISNLATVKGPGSSLMILGPLWFLSWKLCNFSMGIIRAIVPLKQFTANSSTNILGQLTFSMLNHQNNKKACFNVGIRLWFRVIRCLWQSTFNAVSFQFAEREHNTYHQTPRLKASYRLFHQTLFSAALLLLLLLLLLSLLLSLII